MEPINGAAAVGPDGRTPWLTGLACSAEVAVRVGDSESAEVLSDEQLRLGRPAWLAHTRFEWARMPALWGGSGERRR